MINLADDNFKKEVLSSQKPILVDFWSNWCVPCSVLSPILEKVSSDFEDKITFAKIDIDESPLSAQEYGVERIPTVILFNGGRRIAEFIGTKTEEFIKEWLEINLRGDNEVIELINEYEEYAKNNGFKLNQEKEIVDRIVKSLLDREKSLGARYCPCRKVSGDKEEDKKIICPCIYHKEEIDKDGRCHCNLFVK